ncbi:HugZ family protein [Burkholderia glumae]|uniref:HugZ family pyridoxamine 5'-phosphate oxidase n=1 Tax=Burkholderia glumae TaxID=337 RepID=UPI0003A8FD19|nr:pyridoxamine 5'-phosphate oxidase family protein [Burkholderia glumae]MCM2491732.1 pyridoxamine 5'-phosphate oxidase family protein [Burkholderia glumae]MCM2542720.1 pyridoxamine 5'-phosphate oxidase family protein [Burkholderia glumae]
MKLSVSLPIHLLHRGQTGTLATHAREPAGFPYPTIVPYATDARHRPVVLVSALAEHTRNLAADPRAGFLVADPEPAVVPAASAVLEAERVTLVGRFVRSDDDPHLAARYQRYHRDAARYLGLGDFAFWVLECERLRFIGGFGRMGWLDGAELDALPPLSFDQEQALWARYPAGERARELIGVDRHGADWRIDGRLRRTAFANPATDFHALIDAVEIAATTIDSP